MPTAKQRVEVAEQRLFHRYGLDVTSHEVAVSRPALPLRILETGAGQRGSGAGQRGSGAGQRGSGAGQRGGDALPPLLFLHGAGEVSSQWAPLWAQLDDRRCIGVDLPGFGLSGEVDYNRVDLRRLGVEVTAGVIDRFDIDAAVVIGNSLGGAFALWTALDEPGAVRALGLLGAPDPAIPGSRVSLTLATMGVPGVNRLILNLPLPPLSVNRAMYKVNLGRAAIERSPDEIVEVAHHAMDRPTFAPSMTSYMERVFRFRRPKDEFVLSSSELADVRAPTLVVWGDHDAFGPVRIARRLVDRLSDAELVVLEGGHNPWLDRPGECARLLGSFLADRDL